MGVSYDLFAKDFLAKITEYEFVEMEDYITEDILDGLLKRSVTMFNPMSQYKLIFDSSSDERVFDIEINENDIDEIVNIVSEGMVVQWMKTYLYNQEILEQSVNTNDFSVYSPAELLKRVRETYQSVLKEHLQMMREYTYNHSDLSDLHL